MADEWHGMARREELQLHVVIVGFGLHHERGFTVHFRGDRLHLVFAQVVGVEHDDGGVAAEAFAGERIDVEQSATAICHGNGASGQSEAHL